MKNNINTKTIEIYLSKESELYQEDFLEISFDKNKIMENALIYANRCTDYGYDKSIDVTGYSINIPSDYTVTTAAKLFDDLCNDEVESMDFDISMGFFCDNSEVFYRSLKKNSDGKIKPYNCEKVDVYMDELIDYKGDLIVCNNCDTIQLVGYGSEHCHKCNSKNVKWYSQEQECSLDDILNNHFSLKYHF